MKNFFSLFLILALSLTAFTGCGKTEEEKAAEAESARLESAAAEEVSTGLRRLTSQNLEECEAVFRDFVTGLQESNTQAVADAIGVPNVFQDQLYAWALESGFEPFMDEPLENIRVKSTKNGIQVDILVFINTDSEENAKHFSAIYQAGKWILIPDSGVHQNYVFTSPVKAVSCDKVSFAKYAVGAGDNGYTWTFSVPRMPVLPESPVYTIESAHGSFDAGMFEDERGNTMLLAQMTSEQKEMYTTHAEDLFNQVFNLLKTNATKEELSQILLSENIIMGCYPKTEEETAAYHEKLATVSDVKIFEDDIQTGFPAEYTYHLAGDTAIEMNVKIKTTTSVGESRKKATIILQDFDGTWKIVSVNTRDNTNPFVNFDAYNPAW